MLELKACNEKEALRDSRFEKDIFIGMQQHRACPTNGSDCGSLVPRSHNL